MKKRFKMSKAFSKAKFRKGLKVKSMNMRARPMRGGTRL